MAISQLVEYGVAGGIGAAALASAILLIRIIHIASRTTLTASAALTESERHFRAALVADLDRLRATNEQHQTDLDRLRADSTIQRAELAGFRREHDQALEALAECERRSDRLEDQIAKLTRQVNGGTA